MKNYKGFAVVEGLLILIIVGILGGTGWYVFNARNKATDSLSSASQASNSNTSKTKTNTKPELVSSGKTQQYLVVKEWGVEIPLDSSVDGLSYTIVQNDSNMGATGKFRSTALDAIGTAGCTSDSVVIVRGTATQYVPQENGESTTTYKTQYESIQNDKTNFPTAPSVQIGNYYYVVPNYAGASCANVTESQEVLKAEQDAEVKASLGIEKAVNKMVSD